MTNIRILLRGVLCAALCAGATAAPAQEADAARILDRLKAARPDLDYSPPRPSPVPGLYAVEVAGGPTIYVSADGGHFVAGDMFAVGKGGFVNLAEQGRQDTRRQMLAELSPADMIVFAPEDPKATVTVFTDVDCGYCRKLHQEVPELNRLGIAVRYLAYPRAGVGSPSYNKIASAWCSADPKDAITRLKRGEQIKENVCADNPVAEQMLLGERAGVTGTPALVLEDGTLLPGYRTAAQLATELGLR